ncbi:MAG: F0F1 ATP synthase subunit delta [Candidatus Omnitrophota bacterium]|nr:MAG: F0F1 ATP synthase subunit delta [Candidatus Omnitrophota bacterium]
MLIWQLVLIQIVTFALIVFFLRWVLYSHISHALRRLQKLNQENLEKEKALKEELERAKREAEREIEEGRRQGKEIIAQAKEEADKSRDDMLGVARKEAKRMINEAIRDCQRKKTELDLEMQEKAVYLASDMIKSIFTEHGQEDLNMRLIDELLLEIKGLDKGRLKAQGDKAEVVSAYPLGDAQKKSLKEILISKLKKDITLTEKIDKEVISGLIIKVGGFVIDGSIKNKLKKIMPLMKERAKK